MRVRALDTPGATFVVRPFLIYAAGAGSYCYAGDTGAVVALAPRTHRALTRLAGSAGKTVGERALRRAGIAAAEVGDLVRYGVLRPDGPSTAAGGGEQPARVGSVTAILTSRCNLACRYCYAGRAPLDMPPETGRRAVDFLMAASAGERDVHLSFFGGEPLLNWPALKAMVEYGESQAGRHGKSIRFSLTTNGTLLREEVASFLGRHGVSVTVSVDGPRAVHDALRQRPSGRGSYDAVAGRLAHLARCRPAAARVTVSNRALDLPALFDHVHGLGFRRIGMSPLAEFEGAHGLDARDLAAYAEGFEKLAARFLWCARRGKVLGFANLINLVAAIERGETKSHACGAGIGMVTVDPAGKLYACHRMVGTAEFELGDLERGVDAARRRSFLAQGALEAKRRCGRCWTRSLCGGGCHYENYRRGGLSAEPPEYACRFYRSTAAACLRVHAALQEEQPAVLACLAGRNSNGGGCQDSGV